MKVSEHERRDWVVIAGIILIGFACVFVVGSWAVRLPPTWKLSADLASKLDPNSAFLTRRPGGSVEPVDPLILNQPDWINVILTPGALFPTRIPHVTATAALFNTPTHVVEATQVTLPASPTNTLVYIPPTSTSVSGPASTKTPVFTSTTAPLPTKTSTPPTRTPTDVPPSVADLRITINDGATHYDGGIAVQYTIVASNALGPAGATGAVVSGTFSSNLTNISWTCAGTAGTSCMPSGAGDIDDVVNLPVGSSVTYTVSGTVISSPGGTLDGTAEIDVPSGLTDPEPLNNSMTDTDLLVIPDVTPPQIGTTPDGDYYVVPSNTILTIQFGSPLVVGAHNDWDLVYYELPQGANPGIWMDCVVLQVGDGRNWYTILDWGDDNTDPNASMNISTIGVSAETDNLVIDAPFMYNLTGIGLDLDGTEGSSAVVPAGTYKYLRIISPAIPLDDGDGVEVDAIHIVP